MTRSKSVGFAVQMGLTLALAGMMSSGEAATGSRTSAFEYDATTGLITAEIVEPDIPQLCVRTQYTYDAYGNKAGAATMNCAGASGQAVFASRSSSSSFAPQAAVTVAGASVSSPNGAFPTTSTNALNQSETKTYDPRFGAALSLTGPNQLTTHWQVDDEGRKLVETRADGTGTRSESCFLPGRVANTSSNPAACAATTPPEAPTDAVMYVQTVSLDGNGSPNGPFARSYQDRLGREIRSVTQSFDGNGLATRLIVKDTIYNPFGAVAMTTQPYFLDSGDSLVAGVGDTHGRSMTTYDVLGRPIETRSSDGSSGSGMVTFPDGKAMTASRSAFAYKGYAVQVTDDQGHNQVVEKNAIGQTVRTTDAAGAQLASLYDAFANLVKTVDAQQNVVALSYDIRGRKTQMVDPDTGLWTYGYDALGELVAQQSPNERNAGQVTTMTYDLLGRMIGRSEPEFASTWSYDKYADGTACSMGVGKLCEVSTDHGVHRRTNYDGLGRPSANSLLITNGPALTTSVSYDAAGRVASQVYPTGLTVSYTYTPLGFPSQLLNTATSQLLWHAEAMNAWGAFERQAAGNTVQTKKVFDPQTGRVLEIDAGPDGGTGGPTNSAVLRHRYTYDGLSNLTQRFDDNGNGNGAVSENFQYDSINRLYQYQVASPTIPGTSRVVNISYDSIGNIVAKTDVGVYNYGPQADGSVRPHAVTTVNGTTYTYDANGNMTTATGGKFRGISYTSFNLPDGQTGAVGPTNSPRYTWQYDAEHWRIREDHADGSGTRTTWYMHPDNAGGLGFEYEQAANNTVTNRHYLSVAGIPVGVLVSNGAYNSPTAMTIVKTEYWHTDRLGSIAATTDANGTVTNRYAYDPFGKRRFTDGSYDASGAIVADYPSSTDRGFTGHEHLDDIGIVHMNGRLYDPASARFLQADTLISSPQDLQSYNRYSYLANNPLSSVDPTGNFSIKGFLQAFTIAHINPFDPRHINKLIASQPGQAQFDRFVLSHTWAYAVVEVVATAATWYCWGCGNIMVSSYYAYESTGSFNAGFKAALITGLEDVAFHYAGYTTGPLNVAVHAAIGCVAAEASGGKCGTGALSAGVAAAVSPGALKSFGPEGGFVVATLVGGTASVVGGGKFVDGAITGAFGYLINEVGTSHTNEGYGPGKDEHYYVTLDQIVPGCSDACMRLLGPQSMNFSYPSYQLLPTTFENGGTQLAFFRVPFVTGDGPQSYVAPLGYITQSLQSDGSVTNSTTLVHGACCGTVNRTLLNIDGNAYMLTIGRGTNLNGLFLRINQTLGPQAFQELDGQLFRAYKGPKGP